ncbi:MAG: hypothetical protein ACD_21C00164G0004 [uncultured bacterium]|nr:MAG: hypothetical protein ACD_21C00164G0004 [uncultured bacterium]
MVRKTKAFAIFSLSLVLLTIAAASVLAYTTQPIDGNAQYSEDNTVLNTVQTGSKLGGYENVAAEGPLLTAAQIVNLLLTLLGAIAISLTVYAGFIWLLSRGNEEEIKKAKDILAGSAIGLLLILASYSITSYIFREFVEITNF